MPDREAGRIGSELESALRRRRVAGERIVLVVGSFDIVHPGHVAFLQQAARCGEVLVAAVRDDESVRRRRGRGRPLNPLAERIEVLGAIRWVDHTVPCSDAAMTAVIEALAPDVVVRTAEDGERDDPVARAAEEAGVAVTVLPRALGYTQDGIVARVRAIPLGGEADGPAD